MIIVACDLDNTLMFSQKHACRADVCVERLAGVEQGFMTPLSIELLRALNGRTDCVWVPVTSRSVEQYRRIEWQSGCAPRYAVTTNGAVLLVEGIWDAEWAAERAQGIALERQSLLALQAHLTALTPPVRCRMVDDAYLLAFADDEYALRQIELSDQRTSLSVAAMGRKHYFLPKCVDKGVALERLTQRLGATLVIAAGDSPIDRSMLACADHAILPTDAMSEGLRGKVHIADGGRYPEYVLRTALQIIEAQ